ncbi:Progestin and adipoQ receptor family member 6, partial [Nipponia nippon]
REPYHWPLLIYLLLVCLYPFASSCAHTFSSMSARARHICYFCDYGALSLYSLGCAFAYGAYAMPDHWVSGVWHNYFVPAAAFNSFVCTGLSCYSRWVLGKGASAAAGWKLGLEVSSSSSSSSSALGSCSVSGGFPCSGSGSDPKPSTRLFARRPGFLFASHLPKPRAPGRFDYIGHSHQLFHICAVLGTHFQLEAILCDVRSRRAWLRGRLPAPGLPSTFGTAGLALLGNAAIIGAFTAALPRAP